MRLRLTFFHSPLFLQHTGEVQISFEIYKVTNHHFDKHTRWIKRLSAFAHFDLFYSYLSLLLYFVYDSRFFLFSSISSLPVLSYHLFSLLGISRRQPLLFRVAISVMHLPVWLPIGTMPSRVTPISVSSKRFINLKRQLTRWPFFVSLLSEVKAALPLFMIAKEKEKE